MCIREGSSTFTSEKITLCGAPKFASVAENIDGDHTEWDKTADAHNRHTGDDTYRVREVGKLQGVRDIQFQRNSQRLRINITEFILQNIATILQ